MPTHWPKCDGEPRFAEMLSDPIVEAVMAADGVDPQQLLVSLHRTAMKIVQDRIERESRGFAQWRGTTN